MKIDEDLKLFLKSLKMAFKHHGAIFSRQVAVAGFTSFGTLDGLPSRPLLAICKARRDGATLGGTAMAVRCLDDGLSLRLEVPDVFGEFHDSFYVWMMNFMLMFYDFDLFKMVDRLKAGGVNLQRPLASGFFLHLPMFSLEAKKTCAKKWVMILDI